MLRLSHGRRVFCTLLCACCVAIAGFTPGCARAQSRQPAPVQKTGGAGPLLVVGFMGGRIKADNMVHQEAVIARDLQRRNPGVTVLTFANHDSMLVERCAALCGQGR